MLVGTAANTFVGTTVAICVTKEEGTRTGNSFKTVVGIATGVTGPGVATGGCATATRVVGTAKGATDDALGTRTAEIGVKTGGKSIPRGLAAEIAAGRVDAMPGKRLSSGFAALITDGRL